MAREIDLTFLGDKQLEKKLHGLETKIEKKALRHAMRRAGKIVLATAKTLAPRRSGRMADTLKVRSAKKSNANSGQVGVVVQTGTRDQLGIPEDAKYYYPAGVEYGTSHSPAQPFLRPALDQNREEALEIIKQDLHEFFDSEAVK